MRLAFTRLVTAALALAGWSLAAPAAPTKVSFWFYMPSVTGYNQLQAFVTEFNKMQSKYEVTATGQGDPKTEAVKIIASLRGEQPPTMVLVDNAFFNRLAIGGQAANLDKFAATLPAATIQDFYPNVWQFGEVNGHRYGLPWATSMLVLYYNADALQARGLQPPKTWDEIAKTAKALTTRASKGLIWLLDMWWFESLVNGRGGQLFKNNQALFNGPDAMDALKYLMDLNKAGALLPRGYSELSLMAIDFMRTKAMMVVGPTSVFPTAKEYQYAMKIGVVALPGRTIAGEGQIAILNRADPDAQAGAWAFWQYLNRPENLARFVKASFYLPTRRSVTTALGDFIAENPALAQGLIGLERADNFPHAADLNDWELTLNTALERVLKGNDDPVKTMTDAQRATKP
ncbi:MAG TPA: extracellular solute-binding protein [Deinococcales bacterium]|nr:extracellular solute-binding protein [Deinococcales bacterium]